MTSGRLRRIASWNGVIADLQRQVGTVFADAYPLRSLKQE